MDEKVLQVIFGNFYLIFLYGVIVGVLQFWIDVLAYHCFILEFFLFFSLVVVAATYLICGFLYQRFIVGAKGWEQIPNFSFWKIVGNMSAVCITNTG